MVVIACFSFRLFDYCWAAGRSIACDSGAEDGRTAGWLVGWFHYCYSHDGARANAAQLARSVYSQISIRDAESGDFVLVCMACLMRWPLASDPWADG